MSTERKELREKIIDILGAKCKGCDSEDRRVLQIDHVDPETKKQEKLIGDQKTIYRMILDGLLDIRRYQVLCANCNLIKYKEYVSSKD